jgi:hypothetical protein
MDSAEQAEGHGFASWDRGREHRPVRGTPLSSSAYIHNLTYFLTSLCGILKTVALQETGLSMHLTRSPPRPRPRDQKFLLCRLTQAKKKNPGQHGPPQLMVS